MSFFYVLQVIIAIIFIYVITFIKIKPFNVGPSYIKKEDFADAVLEYLDGKLDNFIAHDPNDPNIIKVEKIIEKIEANNNGNELNPKDELYPLVKQ